MTMQPPPSQEERDSFLRQNTPGVPQGLHGDMRATIEPARWGWMASISDGMFAGPTMWSLSEHRLLRRVQRHVRKRVAKGDRARARRDVPLNPQNFLADLDEPVFEEKP